VGGPTAEPSRKVPRLRTRAISQPAFWRTWPFMSTNGTKLPICDVLATVATGGHPDMHPRAPRSPHITRAVPLRVINLPRSPRQS